MDRRHFFKRTVPAAVALPGLLNGFSFSAFGASADDPLTSLIASAASNDHILVLVQLQGGNDGLNMVVPLDMYANYYNARTNVAIPQSKVLRLNGTDKSGLHPAMTDLQNMYNDGKVSVVQSVGYDNQNFSHFRSTDIWMTGDATANRVEKGKKQAGWRGISTTNTRDIPTCTQMAILLIRLLYRSALCQRLRCRARSSPWGFSITDPTKVYEFINPFSDYPLEQYPANKELKYLRVIAEKTKIYSDIIKDGYLKSNNLATYPDNGLAAQLGIVARLIKGGLQTRVYTVTISGFDTHKKQVNASDTTTGLHAKLMKDVSSSISAFQKDLELMEIDDRVLGMTFSEFGRRIKSNASMGTDHGAAAPLFLFGKHVKSGVLGTSPEIPADIRTTYNVAMQYDFRSVYASVLERWFCVKQPLLDSILLENYQSLPVIGGTPCGLPETIDENNDKSENLILKMWPNPYHVNGTVQFSTTGGITVVQQINAMGQVVKVLTRQEYATGIYNINIYDDQLPSGQYFLRLQNKSYQKVITIIKVK